MSNNRISVREQIQRNSVALISLVVALTTLSYSTWRNEKSEDNHNHRQAAFEILLKLNELQRVVFHLRYDGESQEEGNPRVGWTYILTIQDLSQILDSEDMRLQADKLHAVWSVNWEGLKDNQPQVDLMLAAIDKMRMQTLILLRSLE